MGEALEGAGPTSPSLILIGCKLDLVEVGMRDLPFFQIGVRREVGKEEGQALADLLGALFIETSAKQVHLVCSFIKVGRIFVPSNLRKIILRARGWRRRSGFCLRRCSPGWRLTSNS